MPFNLFSKPRSQRSPSMPTLNRSMTANDATDSKVGTPSHCCRCSLSSSASSIELNGLTFYIFLKRSYLQVPSPKQYRSKSLDMTKRAELWWKTRSVSTDQSPEDSPHSSAKGKLRV